MRVRVDLPGEEYEVEVEAGLVPCLGAIVREIVPSRGLQPAVQNGAGRRVTLLSDADVMAAQGEAFLAALEAERLEVLTLRVEPGEAGKSFAVATDLYHQLAEAGFGRGDIIIGFGGGAICDLAGFVAATYKRGLRLVLVPTSLVAQVDACLGGKNALNLDDRTKNTIGTIRQPVAVYVDPDLLATLPQPYYQSGLGEIAKYAMIAGGAFFDRVRTSLTRPSGALSRRERALGLPLPPGEGGGEGGWPALIGECLKIKARLVEADVDDVGERRLLNFGHTFGHALEAVSGGDSERTHGECVAVGMRVATRLAIMRGLCDGETEAALAELLKTLGLPTDLTSDEIEPACERIAQDKKWRDGKLDFVLPRRVGNLDIVNDVTLDEIAAAAKEVAGSSSVIPLSRGLKPPVPPQKDRGLEPPAEDTGRELSAWLVTFVTHNARVSERMVTFGVQAGKPLVFDAAQQESMMKNILEASTHYGIRMLECNVLPDHVHLVLVESSGRLNETVRKIKGYASRAFNKVKSRGLKPPVRNEIDRGLRPPAAAKQRPAVWARKFNSQLLEGESALLIAREYVRNNHLKHQETWGPKLVETYERRLRPLVERTRMAEDDTFS